MEKKLFSLWLIPAEPYYQTYTAIIEQLARELHAPLFEPHVTLFCGATVDLNSTKKAMTTIFEEKSRISLSVQRLAFGNNFYKTLFIEFSHYVPLVQLFHEAKVKLDKTSIYQLKPHLSLLYKYLSLAEKTALFDQYSNVWPLNTKLEFSEVKLMTDSLEESSQAVESWRQLAHIKLQ